ncbi:hypothetical protein ACFQ60_02200 [Streptomyces zhihengii]
MSDTGMTPAGWLLPVTAAGPRQAAYAEALLHLANSTRDFACRSTSTTRTANRVSSCATCTTLASASTVRSSTSRTPRTAGATGYERLRPDCPATRTLDMRDGVVRSTTPLTGPDGDRVLLTTVTAVHATRPSVGVMTGTLRVPASLLLALDVFWDNTRGNAYLGGAVPELAMVHTLVDGVAHRGTPWNSTA